MRQEESARAVEKLLDGAKMLPVAHHPVQAPAAAARTVAAARQHGDVRLLVEALAHHAAVRQQLDDAAGAKLGYVELLTLANDPANAPAPAGETAVRTIAAAYIRLVFLLRTRGLSGSPTASPSAPTRPRPTSPKHSGWTPPSNGPGPSAATCAG